MTNQKQPEEWASRVGVILAVAGSAVGLGNFLRFPGQAATNGGGAFMLPYFIAFLLLGIPICWAEWTIGRLGGQKGFHSSPAIFGAVSGKKSWRYLGVIGLVIPVIVYMYYVVIESWCLGYALAYISGSVHLGDSPNEYVAHSKNFFSSLTGMSENGISLDFELMLWLTVFTINFVLIFQGITRGIEKFCKIAMPIMMICAVTVLVRVLTLGTPNPEFPDQNVLNGLGFMWNPKSLTPDSSWLTTLLDSQVWLAATGQIFFSLSVGFGIIINYSSYLKRDDDIVLTGLTATSTNELFEVCLGGLITIPAAFIFLGSTAAVGSTFGLGFNTLPVVFQYMPGGNFFGFLWFFMLFLAAITSSLSMLQPAIAFLEEALGLERRASVAILGLVTALGSFFVLFFSKNLVALDTMDFWVGTALIFVLATLEVFLFAWVLGVERGIESGEMGAEMRFPKPFRFVIRYISPAYLLIVFAAWSYQKLPAYLDQFAEGGVPLYAMLLIGSVFIFFSILTAIASKRWDRSEVIRET